MHEQGRWSAPHVFKQHSVMQSSSQGWVAPCPPELYEYQAQSSQMAGESYGGVYVPLLAQAVLDGNDAGHKPHINLKVRCRLRFWQASLPRSID